MVQNFSNASEKGTNGRKDHGTPGIPSSAKAAPTQKAKENISTESRPDAGGLKDYVRGDKLQGSETYC